MSFVFKALVLVLSISSFCFAQEDPLPVVGSKWQRAVRHAGAPAVEQSSPVRSVASGNKNFQRAQREQSTAAVDPNEGTIETRSAALDKAVQESRATKLDDVVGYNYMASVRNDSGKTIEVVFWEYRFAEIAKPANVVRRQFLCAMKLKKGGTKELSAFSQLGPSDVIDAQSLAKPAGQLFSEEVIVNRIEFADGSILQRDNWKFDDVKKDVEHATSTPWGNEVCRKL